MINFMVVAMPRSATTWAANWLTTDTTVCLHDEMAYRTLSEIEDTYKTNKSFGISETMLPFYGEKLNEHPAKKVILHRDASEVNQSLAEMGLPLLELEYFDVLNRIDGLHVHYTDLFNNPEPIWNYLIGTPMDKERHSILKQMQIQPAFEMLEPVKLDAIKRYFIEIGA